MSFGSWQIITIALALTFCQAVSLESQARNPWQIQQPPGPPPTGPVGAGGLQAPVPLGLVPKIGPDFWRQQSNQIPAGTVFSTILQEDISSAKSKVGDSFQLILPEGYFQNGVMLVPPGSMVVGSVHTVTPAFLMNHGNPGRIDVSLQALILPTGQSLPISAFIDHNPAHDPVDPKKAAQVHYSGSSLKDYGGMFTSFLGQFGRGIGRVNNAANRGRDFALKQGTVVPVRLTQSLKLPYEPMPAQSQPYVNAQSGVPGLVGPAPNMPTGRPPYGGFAPPSGQAQQGRLLATPAILGPPGQSADGDGVFSQPIHSAPASQMPDPF
jgi:hypothetical protein